ncbi:hypothetical protein FIBSPDRAFT_946824 [Athelia psychrophila]|uniref:Uncharacterized protein n=1 Tax=Athelia psychrophila TaxID=1759441 RepID=A0A166SKY0_9AGAM|nr:hypothetical protein FIBSPDRAFT_946824 [Fibularhizoctonia sp. CBS 109695]
MADGDPKQAFLRETREALKESAAARANLTQLLPKEKDIRWIHLYIFSIITFQPKPVCAATHKAPVPKTVKAKYNKKDIIRDSGKKKFNFSRQALQDVEDGLGMIETWEVASMMESWNSGHAMTNDAKRLHTNSKLPHLAEKFIMEVDQKHMAQVFMMVGIPDKHGNISMTSFETKPPPRIKKFSRCHAMGISDVGEGKGTGGEDSQSQGESDKEVDTSANAKKRPASKIDEKPKQKSKLRSGKKATKSKMKKAKVDLSAPMIARAGDGAIDDPKGKKKAMEEPDIDLSAVKWEVEKALPSSDNTGNNGEGDKDGDEPDDKLELEYIDEPAGTPGPSAHGPPPQPSPKPPYTAAAKAPKKLSGSAATEPAGTAITKASSTAAASSLSTAAAKSAGPAPTAPSGPAPMTPSRKAAVKSAAAASTMPSGTAVVTKPSSPSTLGQPGPCTLKANVKPGPGPGRHYQAPPVGKSAVKQAAPAGQSASTPP